MFCYSVAKSCPTLWDPMVAHQASLSFTISQSLLKLTSIESVMPSNHLSLCHPLLLLPSIFPSISIFSNELALPIRWSMYFYALSAGNRCERINLMPSIPLLTAFQSQMSCFLFLQLRSSFPPWGKAGEVSARATPAWNLLPLTLEWQLLSPLTTSVSLSQRCILGPLF